jgi:predicted DNA-binding protein
MKPEVMKTKALSFRLREHEYQRLQEAVDAVGKPVGEWAREALLALVDQPDVAGTESSLAHIVLEETLAFRSIMLSLSFATAEGPTPAATQSRECR